MGCAVADDAVINVHDDDLNGFDSETAAPSRLKRLALWLLSPLAPLANWSVRERLDAERVQHAERLAGERRRRQAAELKAEANQQKADTLALMHAQIIAMLKAETVFHTTAADRATER